MVYKNSVDRIHFDTQRTEALVAYSVWNSEWLITRTGVPAGRR